jgi:hypothetical protein
MAPQAVQEPIAEPRSAGEKAETMIARELGISSAAAAPCSARATISSSMLGAIAHAIENTPNVAAPSAKTRRSP